MWFDEKGLVGILSTHIDDLKGCGTEKWQESLYEDLVKAFGKVTKEHTKFEHCGIMHVQNEDGSIEITQDHYISELKAIPLTQEQKADVSVGADDTLHGQFLALQGALGWAANTRHDVAVYIGALQRNQQAPKIQDVINLNKVLKWVKRKKCTVFCKKLVPPLKILVISDSAFKREAGDSMACKEHLLALAEKRLDTPGGGAHFLEAVSRRHKRVNRSTFVAETNGLADALEPGKVLVMQFTEIVKGVCRASDLANMANSGA